MFITFILHTGIVKSSEIIKFEYGVKNVEHFKINYYKISKTNCLNNHTQYYFLEIYLSYV